MKGASVAVLAMIAMALLMVHQTQGLSCGELVSMLQPCVPYLQLGGSASGECCNAARSLQGATKSQADRRTACHCAKSASKQFNVNPDNANNLLGKCGISTNIPINPNVDCNSIP